jgi:hypothetical protein
MNENLRRITKNPRKNIPEYFTLPFFAKKASILEAPMRQ